MPESQYAYSEHEVLAFVDSLVEAYVIAGATLDRRAGIWITRMQFDACFEGYDVARAKHLASARVALGLDAGTD